MRGVIIVLLLGLSTIALSQISYISYVEETLIFAVYPTAKRALDYGERHLDARNPRAYDLARAKSFFTQAIELDNNISLARHGLARIAFLEGDFSTALKLINEEIELGTDVSPASYYVRALIKAYMKDYVGAAHDYETYFTLTPANWAGINDYAWVLLKADLPEGALLTLDWGLKEWPDNPWLLNNKATALSELGRYEEALPVAQKAMSMSQRLTPSDWYTAYPGNDPLIAEEGLLSFQKATRENFDTISASLEKTLAPRE